MQTHAGAQNRHKHMRLCYKHFHDLGNGLFRKFTLAKKKDGAPCTSIGFLLGKIRKLHCMKAKQNSPYIAEKLRPNPETLSVSVDMAAVSSQKRKHLQSKCVRLFMKKPITED